ncbi:MAG: tetratricopeptide repeat protein [Treponema sp.]|jgi:tetratricopeptide (TPR) repeat protein|nr:tetratricopeptide repeat protein [Treponema sp.]
MPSLQDLEAFKTSFRTVGKEDIILAKQNIPPDDLPLPDSDIPPSAPLEPRPIPQNPGETGGIPNPVESTNIPVDTDPEASEVSSDLEWDEDDGDFDFSDLLSPDLSPTIVPKEPPEEDFPELVIPEKDGPSIPDREDPLAAEIPQAEGEVVPEVDLPPAEDFSLDDLENTLGLETPQAGGDAPREAVAPEEELPAAEDSSLEDQANPLCVETPHAGGDAPQEEAVPEVDLPPAEDFSLDDLENALGLETSQAGGDAPQEEAAPEADLPPAGDFSLDDLDLENILSDDSRAESDSMEHNPALSPVNLEQDASLEGLPLDTFDAFKVQDEAEEPGSEEAPPPSFESLDEDLAMLKPSADIEEIQLSDEELVLLTKTLESYPLNLRIACEEAIAEQAVDPALMSKLIKSLVKGASVKEMVPLVGKILGRIIIIPKNFEKKTGEALEAAHAGFTYIFVHKLLPILRLFLIIALVVASLGYLVYRFVYTPIHADLVYKKGYTDLLAGDYSRANDVFREALSIHPVKRWFYRYAEGFKDARQYGYAEEKYDELLQYYPRDKQGVLDYASMETNQLNNYAKANSLLRRNILDYAADDKEGLLAVGDNALAWGDIDPIRYEDARDAYARYLERYGWVDPVVERMLKYFIRTDNLREVLPLQAYFMDNPRTKIAPASLAELGGYLLDKKLEEVRGVPNEYISHIDGIRDILVKAAGADPALPESHYHLARYYNYFDNVTDERITLERAVQAFDAAKEEPVRRLNMRIDTERRFAGLLMNQKEFFAAEEHLVKGIGLYEDGVRRQILSRSPQFGRLYADLGDLAYFTQTGDMARALEYYIQSEQNGWAPPEVQYRMGSAYYHQRQWGPALERFFAASSEIPLNRRLLNALGSAAYMRGDYFTAQGYYSRLLDLLHADQIRFPMLLPNERPDHLELTERLMVVRNNLGVTLEALTEQTGDNRYRSQALGLYSESARAWDTLTRNPETLVRSGVGELSTPGLNLAFLNSRNSLHPEPDYEPQLYIQIDKDVLEPSPWEALAPQNFRLSDGLF